MTKWNALSISDARAILTYASAVLQEDSYSVFEFKEQIKQKVKACRRHWVLRELSDFPLFVFLYMTCLHVLYDRILLYFETGVVNGNVEISIGFLMQTILAYVSIKGVITFLASDPDRSKLLFWVELMGLFVLYMLGNACALWFCHPLCMVSVLSFTLLSFVGMLLSFLYIKKENLI